MKILVTGGTGMLGHAVHKVLPDAKYVGSATHNLTDRDTADELVADGWDVVIHAAARVGGIKDNSDNPYDYFTENAQINTNVVNACVFYKVPKLIAISSTCVYPANPPSFPITEEMLHAGPPHETNFGYAYAKRMMQVQIDAARKQFGFKWSVIYPSNLYGPHDTFDLQRSHVVPALMMKMHKAKVEGEDSVVLMGTGTPLRQFTYVDDLASAIVDNVSGGDGVDFNFAPEGVNHSISGLATAIKSVVGYKGSIIWSGHTDGVMRKDVLCPRSWRGTPLLAGLAKTYQWFLENKA